VKNLVSRIRSKASRKELVIITRRKRAAHGFLVTDPDGQTTKHPTKKEALENLFARLRCAPVRRWVLGVEILASEKGGVS